MSEHLNEYQTRLQKLEQLKASWVIPYANKFNKTHSTQELVTLAEDSSTLQPADELLSNWCWNTYSTAWRMMMFRTHWKLSFATIRDDIGDIQICFVKGLCSFNTGRDVVDTITAWRTYTLC